MSLSLSVSLASSSSSSVEGLVRLSTAFNIPSMSAVVGSLQSSTTSKGTSSKGKAGVARLLRLLWRAFLRDSCASFSSPSAVSAAISSSAIFFFFLEVVLPASFSLQSLSLTRNSSRWLDRVL